MTAAKKTIPQRNRKPWKTWEIRALKRLAANLTVRQVAKKFRRTLPAVQQYAHRAGISFR